MRFRLTYNGPLKATQGQPGPMHTDKRAAHKHDIRREFHRQLKELWTTNRFLSSHEMSPAALQGTMRRPSDPQVWGDDPHTYRPMVDIVAEAYRMNGCRFVPLVRKEISLSCSLRILFLRRDFPASVLNAGDIDNRLKTLIDALRMPSSPAEMPIGPQAGEDPFFVLLDDDRQITHVEAETDAALAGPDDRENDPSFARLVITVEVRPYDVTTFNLAFA
ncbi:hypothetical protein SAMN02990966_04116 [Rhodospirillales bacterium URHD0017]|nr:hypothetical protein SAMN02990966_04116 [Rhodospirillales bacterium URHD0017]